MIRKSYLYLFTCFTAFVGCKNAKVSEKPVQPNVLFICVDDLRRELGCYGSVVQTPNIDALAAEGSLFCNHYVQVPTSGASRACMLTGILPRQVSDLSNEACVTRITEQSEQGERTTPESMFHHLRQSGYHTVGIGKISHYVDGYVYGYTKERSERLELPESWDEMLFDAGKWGTGWNAFFGYSDGTNRQGMKRQVKPYECADSGDEGLADGLTANLAVKKLKELAAGDKPFCLAVGFFKPHLPFTAPKKYWDLYTQDSIPLSPMMDIPEGCHLATLHDSSEFNGYKRGDETVTLEANISDAYARKLRHAYYACVSYADAQVGKVLKALKESSAADNTIVVLWGDHGWHLGDLRVWGKHTLHETSLGSTLVIKAPGYRRGVKNNRIVSSIDIYPTLMELCGATPPEGIDGKSFAALLDNPDDKAWDDVAYSYFRKGVSVRTPDYRLSRYKGDDGTITELYSYGDDLMEHRNVADENPDIVARLLPLWEKGKTFEY